MLKPIGMTEGHYECRSLDETLPIFTELLAGLELHARDGRIDDDLLARRTAHTQRAPVR